MKFTHFDAHTHVQFPVYDVDRNEVIERALDEGVGMVNIGADAETSRHAVALAHKYDEGVYATVGLHPGDANKGFEYEAYKTLALDEKVVAIGECGFDFLRITEDIEAAKKMQKEIFLQQMKLSFEVKKPLMIHCRNAMPEFIELLKEHKEMLIPNSVMHFFSGNPEEAKQLLELGFYFTFGGVITFVHDYDETIKAIPLDRLLTETDAPYVTPVPHRGKRNEPVFVIETEKKLAELKGVSPEVMALQIIKNAEKVFMKSLGA